MHRLIAVASFALLAACGGGDPITEEPQAVCQPTIQLFGDSTLDEEIGAAPYWIARFGNRVTNRAVGGTNSTALVNGTDGLNIPWPGSVNAQYAVINHGLRDGYLPFPHAYTPIEQYRANLRTLSVAPGTEVIFQTPNPSTIAARDMTPYAQVMREVAAERGLKVIDVHACFQQQPNWQARVPDGTHPDAQGLQYIVNTCVAPVVQALACR